MERKLDYKKTFILGFGFFAISITWSVYNAFMPLLLRTYLDDAVLIGFIMTIDNYLALFIQPTVGFYSDKTKNQVWTQDALYYGGYAPGSNLYVSYSKHKLHVDTYFCFGFHEPFHEYLQVSCHCSYA